MWLHASNQTASQSAVLRHTPPLLPPTPHSSTLVPAFFPTQNYYATQAGLFTDPPTLYPSICYPRPQAPSLTLWPCFSYSSLCQSLPPFSTSSKPDHLLISGSCRLPSIKSCRTIGTFTHSFKSFHNYLFNTYCVPGTAVSIGVEKGIKQTRFYSHRKSRR